MFSRFQDLGLVSAAKTEHEDMLSHIEESKSRGGYPTPPFCKDPELTTSEGHVTEFLAAGFRV